MSQAAHIAERRQEMLGKLAELDLSAAQAAHTSYMEALGTPEEAENGLTYQRMARSLRQTLALHEKFERANARAAREALLHRPLPDEPPPGACPRDIPAARARADELRNAVHRLIWSEGFEKSDMVRELELRLDDDRCEDAFIDTPLDEQVAELAHDLGLNPGNAARWRDLPAPNPGAILRGAPGPAPRRSSG